MSGFRGALELSFIVFLPLIAALNTLNQQHPQLIAFYECSVMSDYDVTLKFVYRYH